ncbi:MAG: GTPase ObgE [Anaerolineae bacterium]
MFFDEVEIYIRSGNGGDGVVHFRREKYVPRGGPDGGDGGRGGDIILVANKHLNTLNHFSRQRRFIAEDGKPGGGNNRSGAAGSDLRIDVPLGTIVRDLESGAILADLVSDRQEVILLKGGKGGAGNQHFATSRNQAPRLAIKGEPGREKQLKLELRLIADVGIVGVPNAGKSTLLSVISNAKPKIAPYPFTTLEPNLGVVVVGDRDIVFADIPGLIEGAHAGVGLGHSFLRHVQRTRMLVHLLNGESEQPLADFTQINTELALFDPQLANKPQLVVLNKMDLPQVQAKWAAIEQQLTSRGYAVMAISAATQHNTRELVNRVAAQLAEMPQAPISYAPEERTRYHLDEEKRFAFTIEQAPDGSFQVRGEEIERAAKMTYWEFEESVSRFQRILETLGISKALEEAGVQVGDTVFIGEFELEWGE